MHFQHTYNITWTNCDSGSQEDAEYNGGAEPEPEPLPSPTHKPSRCASDEFMCGDGSCIEKSLECNRKYDCADGTDETECEYFKAAMSRRKEEEQNGRNGNHHHGYGVPDRSNGNGHEEEADPFLGEKEVGPSIESESRTHDYVLENSERYCNIMAPAIPIRTPERFLILKMHAVVRSMREGWRWRPNEDRKKRREDVKKRGVDSTNRGQHSSGEDISLKAFPMTFSLSAALRVPVPKWTDQTMAWAESEGIITPRQELGKSYTTNPPATVQFKEEYDDELPCLDHEFQCHTGECIDK
ncbi:Low-density lipoprotein receptor domain class A [Ancylostoma duodenale]|uniref:Low-density lipoprotein receptor domain class A n=1 Tax=Ancylostoma duodenale TaxID=51022 RepID=A0A0C2GTW0_9BILA|nr:Low-density lipoprotein receptor domain class A [Ancylostoma duodenale]